MIDKLEGSWRYARCESVLFGLCFAPDSFQDETEQGDSLRGSPAQLVCDLRSLGDGAHGQAAKVEGVAELHTSASKGLVAGKVQMQKFGFKGIE